jgi:hypothetical protein
VGALFKSIFFLGVIGRERFHFWKLFFWSLSRKPRLFPLAITYAIYGFHFRKVAEKLMERDVIKSMSDCLTGPFDAGQSRGFTENHPGPTELSSTSPASVAPG